MQRYEYRVVPAPKRGEKVKGVKTTEDRFALSLSKVMNDLGREGWEYVRADTLPCEERVGLTGRTTTFQHMLVFRRTFAALEPTRSAAETVAPFPQAAPEGGREVRAERVADRGPEQNAPTAPTALPQSDPLDAAARRALSAAAPAAPVARPVFGTGGPRLTAVSPAKPPASASPPAGSTGPRGGGPAAE